MTEFALKIDRSANWYNKEYERAQFWTQVDPTFIHVIKNKYILYLQDYCENNVEIWHNIESSYKNIQLGWQVKMWNHIFFELMIFQHFFAHHIKEACSEATPWASWNVHWMNKVSNAC